MRKLSTNIFYVYEHWRPDEGVIFYVGKGQKRRAWDTHRGRNRWHKFIFAKLKALGLQHEVRIVQKEMSEREAFDKEVKLIAYWRDQGADLVNLTIGGDGPSGRKHTEEWKQANSARMKGHSPSAETRAKMSTAAMGNKKGFGKKRPQHAIEATAAAQRGIPKNVDFLRSLNAAKRGKPGRPHTAEEDAAASARQKGIPKSEETKARMRKPKSEAHKQKIREIRLGKKHTAETLAILSDSAKRGWENRRKRIAMRES
jgi:hypothetical protein